MFLEVFWDLPPKVIIEVRLWKWAQKGLFIALKSPHKLEYTAFFRFPASFHMAVIMWVVHASLDPSLSYKRVTKSSQLICHMSSTSSLFASQCLYGGVSTAIALLA